MREKFYVTTPIYYVNARPHIGHAYTTIVADVLARRHRLLGDETWFLTGTDEHGQKIERSAAAAGIAPQQFADQVSASFESLWKRMGITNDQYIRTTSADHGRGAQKLFATLYEKGQIYLSSYTGQYCVSEEMFVEGPPGTIGPDGRPTETVTEENFFFRLSEYQLPLLDLIESDTLKITPEARKNEVLSFLRGNTSGAPSSSESHPEKNGVSDEVRYSPAPAHSALGHPYLPGALKDLSVSRSSFTWGIPVPEPAASAAKEKHVIYVWLDALANYISALGYGSDDESRFEKFWPADLHLVGKEIIRFHCVYWPAFLMAAGIALPKAVTAHGWLLFDDAKMSKSKGNIVRTETILDAFGPLCPPAPELSGSGENSGSDESSGSDGSSESGGSSGSDESSGSGGSSGLQPAEPASEQEGASAPGSPERATALTTTTHPLPPLSFRSEAEESAVALAPANPTKQQQDLFAADVLRYFLLREIPFGQDGSFTFEALITRYNADLANGYGNLVKRVLSMIETGQSRTIPSPNEPLSRIDLGESFGYAIGLQIPRKEGGGYTTQALQECWTLLPLKIPFTEHYDFGVDNCFFGIAFDFTWRFISTVDEFVTRQAPWKLSPESVRRCSVLYTAAESIRIITALLHPILPYATASVWQQLGLGDITKADLKNLQWGGLQPGTKLGPLAPIFPRADKKLAEQMSQMEQDHAEATKKPLSKLVDETSGHTSIANPAGFDPAAGPRTSNLAEPDAGTQVAGSHAETTERPGTPPHSEAQASGIFNPPGAPFLPEPQPGMSGSQPADASPQIAIDDFAKVELRVAKVLVCERIPKADKLLRLEVDLGYERRQILSGIAEWYTPEDLIGRRIVVITNLAPRKMRGLESHGMLLAASTEGGKPALATFLDTDDLPLGSRLK